MGEIEDSEVSSHILRRERGDVSAPFNPLAIPCTEVEIHSSISFVKTHRVP